MMSWYRAAFSAPQTVSFFWNLPTRSSCTNMSGASPCSRLLQIPVVSLKVGHSTNQSGISSSLHEYSYSDSFCNVWGMMILNGIKLTLNEFCLVMGQVYPYCQLLTYLHTFSKWHRDRLRHCAAIQAVCLTERLGCETEHWNLSGGGSPDG